MPLSTISPIAGGVLHSVLLGGSWKDVLKTFSIHHGLCRCKRHKLWEQEVAAHPWLILVPTQVSRQQVKGWRERLCRECIRWPCGSYSTSLFFLIISFFGVQTLWGPHGHGTHTHSTAGDPAHWVCRSFSSNASNRFLCWLLFPPPLTQLLVLQNLLELMVFHRKEVLLHFNLYLFGSPTPPLLRASARSVITQQKERKQWVLALERFFYCRNCWWKQKSFQVCQTELKSCWKWQM